MIYFNNLRQTDIFRLNQLQYRAAKLCTGALHFTSQSKLEADLGWESISDRAKFLGICQFQKFHIRESRPLIYNCMPHLNIKRTTRNKDVYFPFPSVGVPFSKSFFPFYTKEFNKLETNLQTERDLSNFKQTLK